ncbi:hypothetical protein XF35_00935 [Streptomyces platensis subsp. clarensis]|nr:hypothetical protein [Streptomyces platensis subsp. clarensis]
MGGDVDVWSVAAGPQGAMAAALHDDVGGSGGEATGGEFVVGAASEGTGFLSVGDQYVDAPHPLTTPRGTGLVEQPGGSRVDAYAEAAFAGDSQRA